MEKKSETFYHPYVILGLPDRELRVTDRDELGYNDPNEALERAREIAEDMKTVGGAIIKQIGIEEEELPF